MQDSETDAKKLPPPPAEEDLAKLRTHVAALEDHVRGKHKELLFHALLSTDESKLRELSLKLPARPHGSVLTDLVAGLQPPVSDTPHTAMRLSSMPQLISSLAEPPVKAVKKLTLSELEAEQRSQHLATRRGNPRLRSFALRYNESSMVAIASWVRGDHTTLPKTIATRDVKYRQCRLCQLWGHYEVDCPTSDESDWQMLKGELVKLNRRRRVMPEHVVEKLEGQVIEQSAQPMKKMRLQVEDEEASL